jgi:hypothetical protein
MQFFSTAANDSPAKFSTRARGADLAFECPTRALKSVLHTNEKMFDIEPNRLRHAHEPLRCMVRIHERELRCIVKYLHSKEFMAPAHAENHYA